VREAAPLQSALHAGELGTHIRAAARPPADDVGHDDAIAAAHESDELVTGTALPASQARAGRNMPHPSVDGGSAPGAEAVGASASGAGSRRAASHSSAAV
jgi:hypothetical protein